MAVAKSAIVPLGAGLDRDAPPGRGALRSVRGVPVRLRARRQAPRRRSISLRAVSRISQTRSSRSCLRRGSSSSSSLSSAASSKRPASANESAGSSGSGAGRSCPSARAGARRATSRARRATRSTVDGTSSSGLDLAGVEASSVGHPDQPEALASLDDDVEPSVVVALHHLDHARAASRSPARRRRRRRRAEWLLLVEALADQLAVARLEDVQRHLLAGQQHEREREEADLVHLHSVEACCLRRLETRRIRWAGGRRAPGAR